MKKAFLPIFFALPIVAVTILYFKITQNTSEKQPVAVVSAQTDSDTVPPGVAEKNAADGSIATLSQTKDFICGSSQVQDEDGNAYNTVIVGSQCWMAKNMNVGKMIGVGHFQADNGIVEKYCYDNNLENCSTDGGLYEYTEAMKNDISTKGIRGICLAGWHIPTDSEWYLLENYLKDQNKTCNPSRVRFMSGPRKHISEWDCAGAGTKMRNGGVSGLNIPLSGTAFGDESLVADSQLASTKMVFMQRLKWATLWSSTPAARSRSLLVDGSETDSMVGRGDNSAYGASSVRCLKDSL